MPSERRSSLVSPGQPLPVQEPEEAKMFVNELPIWTVR